MANKIKISADTSLFKRAITSLANQIKGISRDKISVVSSEEQKRTKEVADGLKKIQSNRGKLNSELKKTILLQMKEIHNSKEYIKLQRDALKIRKQLNSLSSAQSALGGGGAGGKGPGSGGMMGMLGKMGAGGMALGALGAMGGFAVSKARAANRVYEQGIPTRLKLQGRGINNMVPENQEDVLKSGMNNQEFRDKRLQSMDIFGKRGSSEKAVTRRSGMETGFGLESGTFSGLGSSMRGALGGQGADRAQLMIQAELLSGKIGDEIVPFLQTSAEMLSNINSNGITMSGSALSAMANMVGSGVSAEKAGSTISGVHSGIKNASGENLAFMQEAFSRAGLGGKSVMETNLAIQGAGAFGMGADSFKGGNGINKSLFKGMGVVGPEVGMGSGGGIGNSGDPTGPSIAQRIAGGIMGTIEARTGASREELKKMDPNSQKFKQIASSQFTMFRNVMNTGSVGETKKGMALIEKIRDGKASKADKQAYDDLMSTDQAKIRKRLENIHNSSEGQRNYLKDIKTNTADLTGGQLAGVFNGILKATNSMDAGMSSLISAMGGTTPEEDLENSIKTGAKLTEGGKKFLNGLSPEKQQEYENRLKDKKDKISNNIQKTEGDTSRMGNAEYLRNQHLARQKKKLGNIQDIFNTTPLSDAPKQNMTPDPKLQHKGLADSIAQALATYSNNKKVEELLERNNKLVDKGNKTKTRMSKSSDSESSGASSGW